MRRAEPPLGTVIIAVIIGFVIGLCVLVWRQAHRAAGAPADRTVEQALERLDRWMDAAGPLPAPLLPDEQPATEQRVRDFILKEQGR